MLFAPLVHVAASGRKVVNADIRPTSTVAQAATRDAHALNLQPNHLNLSNVFAPQITATKKDAFPDPDNDGQAVPGDTVTYTVKITNNGADDATGVVFTDTIDSNSTLVGGSVNTTPLAINDSYAAVGNVRLSINTGLGVLNNDSDPDGNVLTASAGTTSAQGGNVSVASDGSFTYNPPPGFEGTDTFNYTVTDSNGNTDTATVAVTVGGMIWFVDSNAAAGGDGRLTSPFSALTGAGSFDAVAADAPGENIFLYSGNYTGGLTLLDGQRLIGQGASDSLSTITGITPPAGSDPLPSTGGLHPVITSGANGVNVGMNNQLHGFTVGDTSGTDIAGANFGTLTVRAVVIDGTGQALNLDSGTLDASFANVTVNNRTTTGLFLNNVDGTATFGATSIPNIGAAGGYGIRVQNSAADISFASADISDANQTVAQADANLDSIPETDGDGDAIFLSNNTGSFTLNGGIIFASGNDGIDVRNSSNLTLSNVIIQSPGQDVTGASAPGTGGHAIQAINLTGTNSINGSTIKQFNVAGRDGLRLINSSSTASTVTVDNSTFSDATTSGNGIFIVGRDAADMSLVVQNNSNFTGLTGPAITHIAGENSGSTATVNLTVKDSTFENAAAGGLNTVSADNFFGGKATVLIEGNTFDNVARVPSFQTGVITVNGDATLPANSLGVNIKNNTIQNIGDATNTSYRSIQVFIDDNTNVAGTINIHGNTITNTRRTGIFLDMANLPGTSVNARITNNNLGTSGAPVGQSNESGITIERRRTGGTSGNVLVDGNTVVNNSTTATATSVFARSQNNTNFTVTVTNNNLTNLGTASEIRVDSTGTSTLCSDITGNTLDSNTGTIRLNEAATAPHNVEQASASALATANGISSGNVFLTGTPNFGVSCAAPPVAMFNADASREYLAFRQTDAHAIFKSVGIGSTMLQSIASSSGFGRNFANQMMRRGDNVRAGSMARTGNGLAFGYASTDASVVGINQPTLERNGERRDAQKASATTSALTVASVAFSGETVSLSIGTLPAGKSMTITFQVTINGSVSASEIANQGTVTGSNFASVVTDDPDTGAPNDPTRTPLGQPPTISCPANITVNNDPNAFSASVPFTVTGSGVPAPTVECKVGSTVITSPHTFPVGTTTVQCTATNGIAPDAACSFTVTVNDVQDPVIACPSNIVVNNDAGTCAANVNVGTATATDNDPSVSVSGTRSDAQPLNAPYPKGTTTITWTATDTAGNTDSCTQTVVVNDTESPTITAPPNVVASTDANSCSANVNPGTPTANDNCPGVNVAGVRSDAQPLNAAYPKGTTTITWTATDASGLTASVNQTVTVNDTVAPVITCPANILVSLPANSGASGVPVSFNTTATDNCAGGVSVVSNIASGSVFPVGTTTVTSTATDAAGNTASCSFTVTVAYNFTGFFSPIGNLPALNNVKAGSTIPIKFSLSGNKGLNIFAPGFPASGTIPCNTNDPAVDLMEIDASGNSGLTYDAGSDQYHYNWKTLKAWEGTCRQLVVRLNDGTDHRANFKFK
ncbi:MAG TPA: PxKF domain-containing protein [Pyrinomonadaceae bacterium]